MLELRAGSAAYGAATVLHEVSIAMKRGEVLALIGRNGAGKSTLLKALAGWLPLTAGSLHLDGRSLDALTPEVASRHGVAYVPDNRQIFPTLTVTENLRMARVAHAPGLWTEDRVHDLFPRLLQRQAAFGGALSGGEQQMLAIARALLCNPVLLLLDEPTEGLAPVVVDQLVQAMDRIASEGIAVLLVEQNMRVPRRLAQRCVVLDSGRVGWEGTVQSFESDDSAARLLSV
jgi:branched-chain amino acid transport system ATP-binding protein